MTASSTAAPPIRPNDYLAIDRLLSDEERDIRDTVRAFVQDKVVPNVGDWFEEATIPRELARELGKLGVLGMHLEGYGCAGASATAYGLACMELEAGDSGVRSLVSVQGSLAMFAIWRWGSEEQKQEWLPRMAAGEAIGCFGLTEPDAGSDPGSMRTRARRDGYDWILHGQKMWITNGSIADVAVVWAQTDEGVRGFLVPEGHEGLHHPGHPQEAQPARLDHLRAAARRRPPPRRRGPARGRLAERAALLPQRGPLRDRLGRRRRRPRLLRSGARVQQGAGPVRQADRLLPDPAAEAGLHGAGGEPGDAAGAAPGPDEGRRGAAPRARLDGQARQRQRRARGGAQTARQVLGANGVTLEYPVIRHMNNLESVVTYEGTADVHALVIGGAVTGIQAFR